MDRRTKSSAKRKLANSFGYLGYLFCFLQWFWVVLLYFSVLKLVTTPLVPHADSHTEQISLPTYTLPSSLEIIIFVVVVLVMIAATVYAFIQIPVGVAKTSDKVVHKTAETMAPIIIKSQHKKDTKKNRIKITARLILAIKLLLVIIPVALTAASGLLKDQPVDYAVALAVGIGISSLSVIFFAVQYALARLLHVKLPDVA